MNLLYEAPGGALCVVYSWRMTVTESEFIRSSPLVPGDRSIDPWGDTYLGPHGDVIEKTDYRFIQAMFTERRLRAIRVWVGARVGGPQAGRTIAMGRLNVLTSIGTLDKAGHLNATDELFREIARKTTLVEGLCETAAAILSKGEPFGLPATVDDRWLTYWSE